MKNKSKIKEEQQFDNLSYFSNEHNKNDKANERQEIYFIDNNDTHEQSLTKQNDKNVLPSPSFLVRTVNNREIDHSYQNMDIYNRNNNEFILQPISLNNNIHLKSYPFDRSKNSKQNIYAYNNPAFSTSDVYDASQSKHAKLQGFTTNGLSKQQQQDDENSHGKDKCNIQCPSGQTLFHNHTNCECHFIDQCQITPPVCGSFTCINLTETEYECLCHTGYHHPLNDLKHCKDIDECLVSNTCGLNQICANTMGSFQCHIHTCINGQCMNTNGSFTCICNDGFTRDPFNVLYCKDIDECLTHNCSENEICVNLPGSYRCDCQLGYNNVTGICTNDSQRSNTRRKRIVNGSPAKLEQWPWAASLVIKPNYKHNGTRNVCSGTLVSSWNILTAAHCLDEHLFKERWKLDAEPPPLFKDLFDIHLGMYNISIDNNEWSSHNEIFTISNFTLHPEYQSLSEDGATVKYDLAIIKLNKRIDRSSIKDWICLPVNDVTDQDILKVIGYGELNEKIMLNMIDVKVLVNQHDREQCETQILDLSADSFCTNSTSSGTLGVGDSGAPSMTMKHSRWHIAGIMSKTGTTKSYAGMTNVYKHLDWIRSIMRK
ncbi:unnamed protein product [Didymodactylos carnosus]|uniref:Uncharacterized protein n=1 Tax=Didymodactylos carnosus TaxID=1234261 RepID=A0A813T0E4_9BILA|nr:unnamed protein product [Didymodactylos carnosus]CAF0804410.1 unnamed protein product [Didymodactylos carnosus]CAF3556856.1 unnamed protein product [Didymodactylos carnosus]CAF3589628.1 unnamed protein product [Didymodactylos carnosus]